METPDIKEKQFENLKQQLQEKDAQLQRLEQKLSHAIWAHEKMIQQYEARIQYLDLEMMDHQAMIVQQQNTIRHTKERIQHIYSTYTYRTGALLLFPIKLIKRFFFDKKQRSEINRREHDGTQHSDERVYNLQQVDCPQQFDDVGGKKLYYRAELTDIVFALQNVVGADLKLVSCVERAVISHRFPAQTPWIGLMCVAPITVPIWLYHSPPYSQLIAGSFFKPDCWRQVKDACRGIFVFSSEHATRLKNIVGTPIKTLCHPLPKINSKWSISAFETNRSKKIIQVGWWLQRMHSIYVLSIQGMDKIWIKQTDPHMDAVLEAERSYLKKKHIYFDFMFNSVRIADDPTTGEYHQYLTENIVFAHYYDANTLDLILECIARHTPILINPLPAFREYLGDDYPFYYYSYQDAAEKALNMKIVYKAHEYLKHRAEKLTVKASKQREQLQRSIKDMLN